jgi:hypothetical protein
MREENENKKAILKSRYHMLAKTFNHLIVKELASIAVDKKSYSTYFMRRHQPSAKSQRDSFKSKKPDKDSTSSLHSDLDLDGVELALQQLDIAARTSSRLSSFHRRPPPGCTI